MMKKLLHPLLIGIVCGLLLSVPIFAQVATRSVQMSQDPSGPLGATSANDIMFSYGTRILLPAPLGTTPVLTSCGTSPTITGTDLGGTVTMGTGTPTGCVITFSRAFVTTPHCIVVWPAQILASQSYTVSTTAITLTQTATSSNVVKYWCPSSS